MKIFYGNGEVRFEDAIPNIAAFEIRYKGKMSAESELPNSWILMNRRNKIVGVNMETSIPETLFNYEGYLRILSCRVTDRELNQNYVTPVEEGIDYWENLNTKWEDFTQHPEDFNGTYVNGTIPTKTSIHQVNLQTEQGEWFLEDGTPYYGEYHVHGNGQAMTESKHTKESKNIFRKDAKGNIAKMKKIKKQTRRTPSRRTRTPYSGGGSSGGGGY